MTMTTPALSNDILAATTLHLDVLDDFIAVVQDKLSATDAAFARDSLGDLLVNLADQRDGYRAFAEPLTVAA
jgi:hypothetical protein